MFTGIIETIGKIVHIESKGRNKVFTIESELVPELKVDQSVSHNGVCLTVELLDVNRNRYQITAIDETLSKTTIGEWNIGQEINLERSVTLDQRLDGHLVQGHVDGLVVCINKEDKDGSISYTFELPEDALHLVIPHGSVTLDGISLTIASLLESHFSVAIIPYTLEHTTASFWQIGSKVNVEYDVFGKYLERYRQLYEGQHTAKTGK